MKTIIQNIMMIDYNKMTKDELLYYKDLIEKELDKLRNNQPSNINSNLKIKNIQRQINQSMFSKLIKDIESKLEYVNNLISNF